MLPTKEKIQEKVIAEINSGNLRTQQKEYFEKIIKTKWQKFYRKFKSKSKCFHPGCNNTTIRNSHSISEKSCLKNISSNQYLVTPEFNIFNKELKFVEKSIGQASTFPGFCEDHEKIFSDFENVNNVQESSLVLYQSYRVLCREIFLYRKLINKSQFSMKTYSDDLNKEAMEFYTRRMNEENIKVEDTLEIDVHNKIFDDMQSAEKRHVAYLEKLEMLKKKFDYEISNDKKETNLLYKGFKFNGKLPVAMGGCTLFKLNESTEPIALILNVIPQVKETYVFCMTEADNHTLFQQIINTSFDTPIQVLKFIEFFMMHGTDNWFYTPSEWDYIPDWKKENMEQIGIPKFGYTFKELSYNIIDLDRISK
jgi:hypothetical protein